MIQILEIEFELVRIFCCRLDIKCEVTMGVLLEAFSEAS